MNEFARFAYNLSARFLVPLAGLTPNPSVGGMILGIILIAAMIMYDLILLTITALFGSSINRVHVR